MPKKIVDFYSLHTYLCNLCCLCLIAVATTKSCCKLLQFNFFPNFIHLEMYYLCKQNKLGNHYICFKLHFDLCFTDTNGIQAKPIRPNEKFYLTRPDIFMLRLNSF